MQEKNLPIPFFIILTFFTSCYGSQKETDQLPPISYIPYYQQIDQAERKVVAEDFSAALDLYAAAFEAVPLPFAVDYFNASICAAKSEQPEQAFEWATQLVQKGCPLSFFDQKAFEELHAYENEWRQFEAEYPENRQIYEQNVDSISQDEICYLVDMDQAYYCNRGKVENFNFREELGDLIAGEFYKLMQTRGFPSEYVTGVRLRNDTIIGTPSCFVLLIHHYQNGRFEWNELLEEEVVKGNLRPREFAELYAYSAQPAFGANILRKYGDVVYEQKYDYNKESREMMAMIQENRQRFYLEPHNAHRAKVMYQYQNDDFVPFDFGFRRALSINMDAKKPPKEVLETVFEMGAWVEL